MTVSTSTRVVRHIGNSVTTEFPYDFKIPSADDVEVVIESIATGARTTLTGAEYSISGIGEDEGGNVTYLMDGAPLTSSYAIIIYRVMELTQDLAITNQDGFYPRAVEQQLDNIVFQIQQVDETQQRSLRAPVGDEITDLEIPSKAVRAGKILSFGSDGRPSVTPNDTTTSEGLFDTEADLAGSLVDEVRTWVGLAGRAAPGDGLGGYYKKVLGDPSPAQGVQSADGAWWQLALLLPEMLDVSASILTLLEAGTAAEARTAIGAAATGANTFSAAQKITITDNGNTAITGLTLLRSSVDPADGDGLVAIEFTGLNDVGEEVVIGRIGATTTDVTDGTEDGYLFFQTMLNGAWSTRFRLASGFYADGLTDIGAGIINALDLYVSGTRIMRPFAAICFNGSGTPAVRFSFGMHALTPITDNGAGDYTLAFDAAEPDANFYVTALAGNQGANTDTTVAMRARTVNDCRIFVSNTTAAAADRDDITVIFFR